jgi:4-amino-4-deoxy-L-arabinose transferase-like glycosyltransferase
MTIAAPQPASATSNWAEKTFRALVILFCAGFIAIDLFIIFSRMFYPYQLEWMEGASLVEVNHILQGRILYAPPSIYFVPLIYPPLYFYISAGIAKIIGFGFGALRLVTFLSSAVCAVILYTAVHSKTKSRLAGWLAVGCFASAFMLTGQWFDIARVDMPAAAFSMLGIYLARQRDHEAAPITALLAGIAFAFGFMTKQSALGVALAAIVYLLVFHWRRAFWLAFSFAVSTAVVYSIFWLESAGWINYYLFTIPRAHAFSFEIGRILSVLIGQFAPIPILLIAGFLPFILSPRKTFADSDHRYYLTMAGALIATGVIGRLNAFSGPNVYVSTYLGVALLVGLEAGWLLEIIQQPNLQKFGAILMMLEWILLSAQFAFLMPAFIQTRTIPTQQDKATGDALVARIKNYSGDVLAPDVNYLTLYAGKTPYYNEMAMSEIRGEGNLYPMPEWTAIEAQINALIHAPTTRAVIVDFLPPLANLIADCQRQTITYPNKTTFTPVAGPPNARPNFIITCH